MLKSFLPRFSADDGAQPQTGAAPVAEPQPGGDQPTAGDTKRFSQADLDAIVKDRLDRQKRATEAATEKARKEAEEKALHEQGEYKTLAEQRDAELKVARTSLEALPVLEAERDRYKSALTAYVETLHTRVPDAFRSLIAKLDPVEQLEWFTANAGMVQGASGDGVGSGRSNPKQTAAGIQVPAPNIHF